MISNLRDYIVVLENVISDELCLEILEEYSKDRMWVNTVTGSGLSRDVRRCDAINISDAHIIEQNK